MNQFVGEDTPGYVTSKHFVAPSSFSRGSAASIYITLDQHEDSIADAHFDTGNALSFPIKREHLWGVDPPGNVDVYWIEEHSGILY